VAKAAWAWSPIAWRAGLWPIDEVVAIAWQIVDARSGARARRGRQLDCVHDRINIGLDDVAPAEARCFSNEIAAPPLRRRKKCDIRRADAWQNLRQQGDGP
jgi:hypothetical protein